jgi:isoleucyl-tRNA synthetase
VGGCFISPENFAISLLPILEEEEVWSNGDLAVSLGTDITEALKTEGIARNLNRHIQDLRKKLNLPYEARIILSLEADGGYRKSIDDHKAWLMEQSLAVELRRTVEDALFEKEDENGRLRIQIQRQIASTRKSCSRPDGAP